MSRTPLYKSRRVAVLTAATLLTPAVLGATALPALAATGDDSFSVSADAGASNLPVLANDAADVSGHTITGVDTSATTGTVSVSPDNRSVSYTPATDFVGQDTFTYSALDAAGVAYQATVTVDVTAPESVAAEAPAAETPAAETSAAAAPVAPAPASAAEVAEPAAAEPGPVMSAQPNKYAATESGSSTVTEFTDQSPLVPGSLTVTAAPAVGGTVVDSSANTVTYTAPDNFSGNVAYGYSYRLDGNVLVEGVVTVSVSPVGVDDDTFSNSGASVAIDVLANDLGSITTSSDSLSISRQPANGAVTIGGVVLSPEGVPTPVTNQPVYTPTPGYSGIDTFAYTAVDDDGRTFGATVRVIVSDGPSAAVDDTFAFESSSDGAPDKVIDLDVLANDANVIPESLTLTSAPSLGSAVVEGGIVRYTVGQLSGSDSFSYQVTGFDGEVRDGAVQLDISEPVARFDSYEVVSGTTRNLDVLANDVGADPSTLQIVSPPAEGSVSVVDAKVRFVSGTASGRVSFTYQVEGPNGQVSSATVWVAVRPVAVADQFNAPSGSEDGYAVLTNDRGVPAGATIEVVTGPEHGTVSVQGDQVVYGPDADYTGTDSLTYRVTYLADAGDPSSEVSSAPATVMFEVSNPFVVADDTAEVGSGGSVDVDVLANDSATAVPSSVRVATPPAFGSATVAEDGTLTYAPAGDRSGTDSLTYEVTDSAGNTRSAVVTFDVNPVANTDRLTVVSGSTGSVALLDNDFGDLDYVEVVVNGAHGRAGFSEVENDLDLYYSADTGFVGSDVVSYRITDASGQVSESQVLVDVVAAPASATPVVDSPTPVRDGAPVLPLGPTGTTSSASPASTTSAQPSSAPSSTNRSGLAYTGGEVGLLAGLASVLLAAGGVLVRRYRRN